MGLLGRSQGYLGGSERSRGASWARQGGAGGSLDSEERSREAQGVAQARVALVCADLDKQSRSTVENPGTPLAQSVMADIYMYIYMHICITLVKRMLPGELI